MCGKPNAVSKTIYKQQRGIQSWIMYREKNGWEYWQNRNLKDLEADKDSYIPPNDRQQT